MMRLIAYGALGVALLAMPGVASATRCDDDAAVRAARDAADLRCDCDGARNHGEYVSCVNDVAKERVDGGQLPQECKGAVTECAARSTCGKPDAVTCCRVDSRGRVKCSIKKNAGKCKSSNKTVACVGSAASCCDSCQASSTGGAFVCEGGSTTTSPATSSSSSTATPTTTPTTSTAAPTTSSSAAPTTSSTAAPTTSSSSTVVPTTSSTSTLPGSPSGAFLGA